MIVQEWLYRYGAKKINLCFRRTKDDMIIGKHELEAMEAEGVDFSFLVNPIGLTYKDGKITGLKLIRTKIEKNNKLTMIEGSEFVLEADTIIFAIGQKH